MIDIYDAKGKLLFSAPNVTRANEWLQAGAWSDTATYYCGHDGGAHRTVFKRGGKLL